MSDIHHIMSGQVWHRRNKPVGHEFSYAMNMVLVDLDEQDSFIRSHWLVGRSWHLLTLRDRDFVDDADAAIATKVREKAAQLGLDFNSGRVLMLAQLRGLGWQFNPLVLYCFIPEGSRSPTAVLAEVRNTPWRERHWYALQSDSGGALTFFRHAKGFHVSPFLGMDMEYQWELDWEEPLVLQLSVQREGETVFAAGLRLSARPAAGVGFLQHFPGLLMQGLRTSVGIYWQAFRLWRKKVPLYRHPDKSVREGGH